MQNGHCKIEEIRLIDMLCGDVLSMRNQKRGEVEKVT